MKEPLEIKVAFRRLRLYDNRLELTILAFGRIQCARKKTFPRTAISEVFISVDEELPEKLFIGCPLSLYTWAIAWMRIEGAKVEPSTVH